MAGGYPRGNAGFSYSPDANIDVEEERPKVDAPQAEEISGDSYQKYLKAQQKKNLSAPLEDLSKNRKTDAFSLAQSAYGMGLRDLAGKAKGVAQGVAGFVRDPFGDNPEQAPQKQPDALAQPKLQAPSADQPPAYAEDEDFEFERRQQMGFGEKPAGNAASFGPSKRELINEHGSVQATVGGKNYEYAGSSKGLPLGETMDPGRGSVSFAGVSGNNPGAQRLEAETTAQSLKQMQGQRALATEKEGLRMAQLAPEQQAMEKQRLVRRELETILGTDENTFVRSAGDAAAAELAADSRFSLLPPQQQAGAIQKKRMAAEAQARQEHQTKIMELYIKRFNTNPLAF